MRLFSLSKNFVAVSLIFLFFSNLKASCPVTCSTTGAQFCNLVTNGLCVTGNEQIGGSLTVCGTARILNTAASTGCTNGALVVSGGVGIGGNLNVCGTEHIFNSTSSTGCTNGALVVDGGVGIGGNLNVCGNVHLFSTGASTGCTNGALIIDGGVGIGGNLNVCGLISASGFTGTIVVPSPFAMFYGLTAGTGNGGPTDYAATIPVKTAAGTGRVPFPRNGPAAGIARIDDSSFTLPNIGTYEITFKVHTTEPGQLQLELNSVDLPETVAVNMNPTAGGHPIIGNFFITTSVPNSVIAVINPAGNTPALTITPADGADTHANAQSITIRQIG